MARTRKSAPPSAPVGVEGLMQLARNWCLAWGEWAHDADSGGAKENAAEAALRAALTQALAQQPAVPSAPLDADARLIAAAPALLEACETFAEWLRREDEGLPAGIERGAPDGERRWREWWNENLRICALAQEQARAAIRQATEGEGNE